MWLLIALVGLGLGYLGVGGRAQRA